MRFGGGRSGAPRFGPALLGTPRRRLHTELRSRPGRCGHRSRDPGGGRAKPPRTVCVRGRDRGRRGSLGGLRPERPDGGPLGTLPPRRARGRCCHPYSKIDRLRCGPRRCSQCADQGARERPPSPSRWPRVSLAIRATGEGSFSQTWRAAPNRRCSMTPSTSAPAFRSLSTATGSGVPTWTRFGARPSRWNAWLPSAARPSATRSVVGAATPGHRREPGGSPVRVPCGGSRRLRGLRGRSRRGIDRRGGEKPPLACGRPALNGGAGSRPPRHERHPRFGQPDSGAFPLGGARRTDPSRGKPLASPPAVLSGISF